MEAFDLVGFASVLPVISDDRELTEYLENAYAELRPGGIFFGFTVGMFSREPDRSSRVRVPPRVMLREHLAGYCEGAGCTGCEIGSKPHPHMRTHDRASKNACIFEFVCEKPAEP
jgi:hypothetical protein